MSSGRNGGTVMWLIPHVARRFVRDRRTHTT